METSKNETSKLKKGALILVFSSVLVKIISAIFKIPLASNFCLGDLGFGYFSSAHDIFIPIHFVAVSGFPVAISQMVSEYVAKGEYSNARSALKASKKLVLTLGLIGFAIYVGLILLLVPFTDKTIYSFLAVAPSILFCLWASCYRGYYEGLSDMRPAAISGVIEALGKLVLGLGVAFFVLKISGNLALASAAATFGISLGALFSAIYLRFKYKRNNGLKVFYDSGKSQPIPDDEIIKKLLLISIPIVAASLLNSAVAFIDALTVKNQISDLISNNSEKFANTYSALISELKVQAGENVTPKILSTALYGIRSKAYTLFNLIPTLTMSIGVGLIPVVTASFSTGERKILKTNISAVLKLSALICFPAGLGFIVFSEKIMVLLYGSVASSQIGGQMLAMFGIAAIFAGFSLPLASILQAIGKQNVAFINISLGIVLKLILNLTLCNIYEINIYGSAISTVACFGLTFVLHLICILKYVGIPTDLLNSILKPVISAGICVVAGYGVGMLSSSSAFTAISIFTAMVVYFVVLSLFNTFDDTDILALPMGEKLLKFCKRLKILR